MKTHSMPHPVAGAAVLLALLAALALAARALSLPSPALPLGLALVALGLRIGVMYAAVAEPSRESARPVGTGVSAHRTALHAANG